MANPVHKWQWFISWRVTKTVAITSNAHTKQWIVYSIKYLTDFLHSTQVFIRGNTLITGYAQTLQTRWLWALIFIQQCLKFVDIQYGTSFMSPFRHLGFWGGSLTFRSLTTYIYMYICRTAAITCRHYILNIYSTNIHTGYFKHAA